MSILKNPSSEELSALLYHHRNVYRGDMWQSLGGKVTTVGKSRYYFTGASQSAANGVISTEFDIENIEKEVDDAIAFFNERHVGFAWLTGAVSIHKQIYSYFQTKGFKLKIQPGLGLVLEKLSRTKLGNGKLSIIRGDSLEHVEMACKPCLNAWGFPREISEPYWKKSLKTDTRSFFIALLNGEPVGISEVLYWGGVAGLYFVGVSEEAREHGIGTAVTLAPLYEAKDLGYQWAILQSTQIGLNMYKRIGFETFCELGECHWSQKD